MVGSGWLRICVPGGRARPYSHTLWEKGRTIGGQPELAATPPGKGEFRTLPVFFETMLRKYGVHVELGREATVESIQQGAFDAVILATGSTPKTISLAGNHPGLHSGGCFEKR